MRSLKMQKNIVRIHGGRPPRGVIDFSSPQTPFNPPKILIDTLYEALDKKVYTKYPDYEYTKLRKSIAYFYDIEYKYILPLNGSAELIELLIPTYKPNKLVIIEPTFGDHYLQCKAAGLKTHSFRMKIHKNKFVFPITKILEKPRSFYKHSIILYSNPNNPTGAYTPQKTICEILEYLPRDSLIVSDEAFIEFISFDHSFEINDPRMIILRSFTKIFGVPGLRLGFAYTINTRIIEKMNKFRQAWNINSITSYVFSKILYKNKREILNYIVKVRKYIRKERTWLLRKLSLLGLRVYESDAPYILVRHNCLKHPHIQQELIKHGVYVRDASSFKYLTREHSRISIKHRKENKVLIEAFKKVMDEAGCLRV
jgi:threonine-phosphate decarboxylase